MTAPRREGTVKFYDAIKGWGFIKLGAGERDVFVHKQDLTESGVKGLVEDDKLAFDMIDKGKGPKAVNVQRFVIAG